MSGIGHFFHKVVKEVTRPIRQVVGGVAGAVLGGRAAPAPVQVQQSTPAVVAPDSAVTQETLSPVKIVANTTRERRRGKSSLLIPTQGINIGGSGGGLNV